MAHPVIRSALSAHRREHPGIFRNLMAEHEIAWDPIELDEGEPILPLDGYDALMVMGGPMDVFDEEELP